MTNWLNISRLSLRMRIFLSMIAVIVLASILLASISIIQFKNEAKTYHQERLESKENAIREHINYVLTTTTYPINEDNVALIFKDRIHELADIHNIEINIYGLKGDLLISSKAYFEGDPMVQKLQPLQIELINSTVQKRYVDIATSDGVKHRSSFTLIKDPHFKPLAILNLPYVEDDGFYENALNTFLIRLGQVYGLMLLIAFAIAYFLSSFITSKLETIANRLKETRLLKRNEKIGTDASSREIHALISAYNELVDELEWSAVKLAQSEREDAWREMAKQVAHEIKNPLTPMRLSVQSFERRFNPEDPNYKEKLKEFCLTMIQQIDTMTAVASAFSNFASLPAQQNESINVVEVIALALEIFNEDYIKFEPQTSEIIANMDRTQLVRIITNLVKNATQAIPENKIEKIVKVSVKRDQHSIWISVTDNGSGIEPEIQKRIFEPKFTTKTSGMGLGLGIIKNIIENYKGSITFETKPNVGTRFNVRLPLAE